MARIARLTSPCQSCGRTWIVNRRRGGKRRPRRRPPSRPRDLFQAVPLVPIPAQFGLSVLAPRVAFVALGDISQYP